MQKLIRLVAALLAALPVFAGVAMVDPKLDDPAKPWCYFTHPITCIGMPWQPDPVGIQVTPEGNVYTGRAEFCLFWGEQSKPLACRQRQFLDGYIPVVGDTWTEGALRYDYEVFGTTLPGDAANTNTALFAKLVIRNTGSKAVTAKAAAAFRHNGGPHRELGICGPSRAGTEFNRNWKYEIKDNQLWRGTAPETLGLVGIYPAPARWEAVNGAPYEKPFSGNWYGVVSRTEVGIARYEQKLAPGKSLTLIFKFPRLPTADAKYLAELQAADYAACRQQTVAYWKNALDRFSVIHTPGEPLIEQAHRASAAHVLLATRTYSGQKTQTDGLPYTDLFLTAVYDYAALYEQLGLPDFLRVNFPHFTARQQADGLFVDTTISHGQIIFCGHGQPMIAIANDILMNRDAVLGKQYFPAIRKGIDCIIRDSKTQPHGLMRPSIPYDNEMIKGQYTTHNYWSLLALRSAIRLARFLGEDATAADWLAFHDEYEKLVLKAVRESAAPDGYVPTGLYGFITGEAARSGFGEGWTDQDWENEMLLWPTELVQPGDPLVAGTLKRLRDTKYREGIMTYRQYLHQYITSRAANQYVLNGQPKEALIDTYHALLHGGSAAESFEFQLFPWSIRDVEACPPPHAWGCCTTNGLIRNLLIAEQGGRGGLEPEKRDILLFNAISPAWLKNGEALGIENAPTSFGTVTALMTPRKGGADIVIKTGFHTQPGGLVVRIPYFVTLTSFTTNAKASRRDGEVIRLSPDATKLSLAWTLNPAADKDLFQSLLLRHRREITFWEGKRSEKPPPPAGFLTDAEKAAPSPALSFKTILAAWQHDYARRLAEEAKAGGKLHAYAPVPMQPAAELKASLPVQNAKSLTTGRPVTCSRAENPAELANDGCLTPSEFWESNEAKPWWQVDLGKGGKPVACIRVVPYYSESDRFYQFVVKTSLDGTTWTTVLDLSQNTKYLGKAGAVYAGAPVQVRYIRVEMLKNSANTGKHLVEVLAYSEAPAAVPAWPPKDDPSARTWLPMAQAATLPAMAEFLKPLNGSLRILGCWYEGNQLRASRPFADGKLTAGNSAWTCDTRFSPSTNDLTLIVKTVSGETDSAGIAVAFDFTDWTTDNYVLAPAMIYGGNRFRILPIGYPPYIHNEKDRPLDMPVTTTNILHLNPDGSQAKIEMNSGNVATPMLSFFNPRARRGFILLAEQGTRFGNNGLFIEEDAGPAAKSKRISFVVSAPGVREQKYTMCGRGGTGDHGADWQAGDELTLKFKVYNFACADLATFYANVFDVRKALSGQNPYSCVTPYSACASLITAHHDKDKWAELGDKSYYTNGPGSSSPWPFQIGWNGVPIYGFPCLVAQTPESLRHVSLSFDNMLMAGQGKTGLYYAIKRNDEKLGDTFSTMSQRRSIAMIRRSADVLYFGLRSLELMKQRGQASQIKPEWEKSFRACANGFVKVWQDYGQFGQFIDVETGKMDINGSTAGCSAGASLALASRYFKEPKYLEVAEAAMTLYCERDLRRGYSGGGPAEILQAPDSESTTNLVESCIALYEITGKPEWLERAKFATHLLSTWMMSYDYQFPKGSDMERAGIHAAGTIFASSQNNHSAPGYYILSGDCLLKLFRATGDPRYAEMYKDQSHNVVQYAGAPHNPLRKQSGAATERVQVSDWEGNNIGEHNASDSNMAWESLIALSCLENPGIYLHTDDDTFLVMDHIEAQIVDQSRWRGTKTLKITNPTQYDATVAILAETAKQAKTPLGWGAHDQWPRVTVKAGATLTVTIAKDGKCKALNTRH